MDTCANRGVVFRGVRFIERVMKRGDKRLDETVLGF